MLIAYFHILLQIHYHFSLIDWQALQKLQYSKVRIIVLISQGAQFIAFASLKKCDDHRLLYSVPETCWESAKHCQPFQRDGMKRWELNFLKLLEFLRTIIFLNILLKFFLQVVYFCTACQRSLWSLKNELLAHLLCEQKFRKIKRFEASKMHFLVNRSKSSTYGKKISKFCDSTQK